MTERQEYLLPYIRLRVEEILENKKNEKIVPLGATDLEIMLEFRDDLLECMRELHRLCEYKASRTINYPMLIKNTDNN